MWLDRNEVKETHCLVQTFRVQSCGSEPSMALLWLSLGEVGLTKIIYILAACYLLCQRCQSVVRVTFVTFT